jgi:Holliday junction resolvase RusA-like endonuclease
MSGLQFTVLGRPQPAGSKRAFPVRKGGQITGVAVTDDAKRSRPWKDSVAHAAHYALLEHSPRGEGLLDGPLELRVDFYVARPAGHYGTGRNREHVKRSAPARPVVRPDVTKLLRAVEDGCTGIIWRDDAQVVTQIARKFYGVPERAEVEIAELRGVV